MSRWWSLAIMVPLLNLWLGFRCFACPPGYAVHKKIDAAGIVLAILYWIVALSGAAIVAALIAAWLGFIGSPEFQQQLRTWIQIPRLPLR
jgi:hypothetical protein